MLQRASSSKNVIDLATRRRSASPRPAGYHLLCGPNQAVLVCSGSFGLVERPRFAAILRRLECLSAEVVIVLSDVTAADPHTVAAICESQQRREHAALPHLIVGSCSAAARRALSRARTAAGTAQPKAARTAAPPARVRSV